MTADLHRIFPLRPGRVHEACGPSAAAFAAVACASVAGNLLWIRESWQRGGLYPPGLARFFDPARLLVAEAGDHAAALAVAEEALRSGAVALVVVEPSRPLGLTSGRRLQLAAKAGGATGLCLIQQDMGSNAAETRWHVAPVCAAAHTAPARTVPAHTVPETDSTLMRWEIIKNKSGTFAGSGAFGAWHVRWNAQTRRLDVVSPAGERPGAARAPG